VIPQKSGNKIDELVKNLEQQKTGLSDLQTRIKSFSGDYDIRDNRIRQWSP